LFWFSDRPFVLLISIILVVASPVLGQDDVNTRNGASAYGGAFITGPASNPLSFLNGDAYRTFASQSAYLIPDFAPALLLNGQLPQWIGFGVEERFRFEGYHNGSFKLNNDDSYFLNRFRLQMNLQPTNWFKVVAQVQDAAISRETPSRPPERSAVGPEACLRAVRGPDEELDHRPGGPAVDRL